MFSIPIIAVIMAFPLTLALMWHTLSNRINAQSREISEAHEAISHMYHDIESIKKSQANQQEER